MPEPFKNLFNKKLICGMAKHFEKQWPAFNAKRFVADASRDFHVLELKQRSQQITDAMIKHLPDDFEKSGAIMLACLGPDLGDDLSLGAVNTDNISGWAVMPMADYVGELGHDYFDLSMTLLKSMTKCSSSEFAIRFFLIASPKKTLAVLKKWTQDDSQHVRRLVSEGTRPRLPWAMRLPVFIEDPLPVIALLEKLKDDEKEYVRRSVANNLNDISKDHPDLVAEIAQQWMVDASDQRKKLIRHACRTLIKSGHKKALRVLGYGAPKIADAKLEISTPIVEFGNALQFSLSIRSTSNKKQALMIDYVIHHQKANGKTTAKVFKWKSITFPAKKTLVSEKNHVIKKITTRVYYPGEHSVEVMVNGVSVGMKSFQLLM